MEYYLHLLLNVYKSQLLISPINNETYTIRARRSAEDKWITVDHKSLTGGLFEICNRFYEQDQRLQMPQEI